MNNGNTSTMVLFARAMVSYKKHKPQTKQVLWMQTKQNMWTWIIHNMNPKLCLNFKIIYVKSNGSNWRSCFVLNDWWNGYTCNYITHP
jgi:hypothetical protein